MFRRARKNYIKLPSTLTNRSNLPSDLFTPTVESDECMDERDRKERGVEEKLLTETENINHFCVGWYSNYTEMVTQSIFLSSPFFLHSFNIFPAAFPPSLKPLSPSVLHLFLLFRVRKGRKKRRRALKKKTSAMVEMTGWGGGDLKEGIKEKHKGEDIEKEERRRERGMRGGRVKWGQSWS